MTRRSSASGSPCSRRSRRRAATGENDVGQTPAEHQPADQHAQPNIVSPTNNRSHTRDSQTAAPSYDDPADLAPDEGGEIALSLYSGSGENAQQPLLLDSADYRTGRNQAPEAAVPAGALRPWDSGQS